MRPRPGNQEQSKSRKVMGKYRQGVQFSFGFISSCHTVLLTLAFTFTIIHGGHRRKFCFWGTRFDWARCVFFYSQSVCSMMPGWLCSFYPLVLCSRDFSELVQRKLVVADSNQSGPCFMFPGSTEKWNVIWCHGKLLCFLLTGFHLLLPMSKSYMSDSGVCTQSLHWRRCHIWWRNEIEHHAALLFFFFLVRWPIRWWNLTDLIISHWGPWIAIGVHHVTNPLRLEFSIKIKKKVTFLKSLVKHSVKGG